MILSAHGRFAGHPIGMEGPFSCIFGSAIGLHRCDPSVRMIRLPYSLKMPNACFPLKRVCHGNWFQGAEKLPPTPGAAKWNSTQLDLNKDRQSAAMKESPSQLRNSPSNPFSPFRPEHPNPNRIPVPRNTAVRRQASSGHTVRATSEPVALPSGIAPFSQRPP